MLAEAQAAAGSRLVAKVADFGLSLSLNPGETHVSDMHAVRTESNISCLRLLLSSAVNQS
jgi:hypothetical protein